MTDTCKICGKGESAYATYHMPSCPKFDGYENPITLTREEAESISAAMKEAAKHIAIGSSTQYSLDVRQDAHYDIDAALAILNSKLKE